MFLKFTLASHDEHDQGEIQKICLNSERIEAVQQLVRYEAIPIGEPDFDEPRRRIRVGHREQRRPVIELDRFIIQMKNGNSWTVMGSFDEFCEILTRFSSKKETVNS